MTSCRRWVFGLVVAVGVLAAGRAQEPRGAGKEVVELARQLEAGKDIEKEAVALRKRFGNIRSAMRLYNPRSAGGIGYGPRGDGIEGRLADLSEKPTSAEALKKESADLARVAHINLVMAEVVRGFAPEKPFLGRGKKEWDRDADGVKVASRDLLKALKENDPRAVQSAAIRVTTACNTCHDAKR